LPFDPSFYFEIYTGKISWREIRKKFKTRFPRPLFDVKKIEYDSTLSSKVENNQKQTQTLKTSSVEDNFISNTNY
jgi:hypothetical protein